MSHHDHDDHDDHDHHPEHPKDRPLEAGDPMQLTGVEIEGDPLVMLDCIVEEYAGMGWDQSMIIEAFSQPFYQGLYGLTRHFGAEAVQQRIGAILSRCGVMRVKTVELEAPEGPDFETVPITIQGRSLDSQGEHHHG